VKLTGQHASASPPHPADGFAWVRASWGLALRADALAHVAHGWTAKPLRLRGTPALEEEEWAHVAGAAGVPRQSLVRLHQVHGASVHAADAARTEGTPLPQADIALASRAGIAVAVQVADCVPLLVAGRRSVAAAHAGWRGTAANVAGVSVDALVRTGERPADLHAAIGPSIGVCCYEVGDELVDRFAEAGWLDAGTRWFSMRASRRHLDLWTANRDQLLAAGVPASHIHVSRLCTACHAGWFHSYRRDGAGTGRIAGFIRAPSISQG
jgi:YfiH family protein